MPNFRADQLITEETFLAAQRSADFRTVAAWDDQGNLAGGLTGQWYPACRVFLFDYLVVNPGFRGGGVGSALLRHGRDRWSRELHPLLMLGEVEDPRRYRDTGFGDPQLRFRLYERLGARVLDLPYFQPALDPSSVRVTGLLLMVFAAGPDAHAAPDTVVGRPLDCFLREYVVDCEGLLRDDDADLERLLVACARTDGVPLLPVGTFPVLSPP